MLFSYDATAKVWYGIAGVSLQTHPGTYAMALRGTTSRGSEISFSRTMTVRSRRSIPRIAVTVAKRYTQPSKEQLVRIQQDKTVKQDVFQHTAPEREWSGNFRAPVEARVSDVFGTRRTFNGKVQSMHQGLDFAVPTGTPVSAANSGTVLLAGPLYFEGNCVVIDHGQGLLTLYLHLSEIKVKQGERVARGQELGLSGGTGRATGPHLHLAVRWQGVYSESCYAVSAETSLTPRSTPPGFYKRPSMNLPVPFRGMGKERIEVRRSRFLTSRCR